MDKIESLDCVCSVPQAQFPAHLDLYPAFYTSVKVGGDDTRGTIAVVKEGFTFVKNWREDGGRIMASFFDRRTFASKRKHVQCFLPLSRIKVGVSKK